MADLDAAFRERAELLGPRRALVAIATLPLRALGRDETAVVFLNTGIVHRIGHHRMYVELSRRIAALGGIAARFDLSGIGDSLPRDDATPPLAAVRQELGLVIDWLGATSGVSRVVLVGLCSGADHAVVCSRDDPRVAGLVLLDPSLPPTRRYYLHYVAQRLGDPRHWLSLLTGRSGLLQVLGRHLRHRGRPQADPQGLTLESLPFSPYLRQCYREAAARGLRLLALFTEVSPRHTYQRQIVDAFPEVAAGGGFRLEYFPDSDHLFSRPEQRERLYRTVLGWLGFG